MAKPKPSEWSPIIPDKPGFYLFYGDPVSPFEGETKHASFHVCEVFQVSNGVMRVAGGQFMDEGQFYGVFKPLGEKAPNLGKFGFIQKVLVKK